MFNWKEQRSKDKKNSFEDAFLIIWSYWLNVCFPRTSVRVCGDNHITKSGDNPGWDNPDTGISDTNRLDDLGRRIPNVDGVDNLGTYTPDVDKVANSGIYIADIDKVDNQDICTSNTDGDGKTNNPGIGRWPDRDGGAEELGTGASDADVGDNPSTHTSDVDKNGRADNPDTRPDGDGRTNNQSIGKQQDGWATASNAVHISFFFFT